jgi:hypothetical protein
LLDRGVQQFKFVDRTFNLNLSTAMAILEFFRARWRPGLFLHFEMIPDRFPPPLRDLAARFPAGTLQFEVGIQSFDPLVGERIRRRQDLAQTEENLRYLRRQTGVHLHADLILGLPGESLESIAAGFDRLIALGPQEIQVGMLKRLRGTSIGRHDTEWQMVYSPEPPYEILRNRLLDFPTLQRLRRFARYWDLVGNSGRFVHTTPLLWQGLASPFAGLLRWSDWLFGRLGRQHGIAPDHLAECLFRYLTAGLGQAPAAVAEALRRDYHRVGRPEPPVFLRAFLPRDAAPAPRRPRPRAARRQARHQPKWPPDVGSP